MKAGALERFCVHHVQHGDRDTEKILEICNRIV